MFLTNRNLNNFGRGSPKDHWYQIIFQIGPVVSDKKIFYKVFPSCMEWKSLNNFERGPPKDHSCEVWCHSPSGLGDVI